jgi:SOS regulatory protein LexA
MPPPHPPPKTSRGGARPGSGRRSLMGRAGEHSPTVQVTLTQADLEAIDAAARHAHTSRSQVVRDCAPIPVLGRVAAGPPVYAFESPQGWISGRPRRAGEVLFALRVDGSSMQDAGIVDGGLVIIRQSDTARDGDIILALIDSEEATIKRLYRERDTIVLAPANPALTPRRYDPERVQIQGVVVEARRLYEEA